MIINGVSDDIREVFEISDIRFEDNYMILIVNGQILRFKLEEISIKLAKATTPELNDFRISPSGYGIHWNSLDEDLSVNGLLKAARK